MKSEITLEEWKDLFEISIKINNLRPCDYIDKTYAITIIFPDREEPCFCSFFGMNGECIKIFVFNKYKDFRDFVNIENCGLSGVPLEYTIQELSYLSCNWGDKKYIPDIQKSIINDLELEVTNENGWLYFESNKRGFTPYTLNKQEVLFLTKCLKHLYMAVKEYIEEEISVNFERGETILHQYDKKQKQWITQRAPLPYKELDVNLPTINDELLKLRLKRQPKNDASLELDLAYANFKVRDKNYERPINPKQLVLIDAETKKLIYDITLEPCQNEEEEVLNMLIDYILTNGKMKKLSIRNPVINQIIYNLCNDCKIFVSIEDELPAVDNFFKYVRN